jgi:AcrR family transcriptional regulator
MSEAVERERRPGRPRSAAADSAIVQATLELLLDEGYRGLTMEQVRVRAGVGKATLYRRYGSKQDLVADAVRHLNQEIPLPDTGTARGDILAVAGAVLAAAARVGAATFIPRLLAESAGDPEMHAIFYENLVAPRRAVMAEVLRRGIDRGELRADLDVELAIDVLTGPWVYRLLIAGGDPDAIAQLDPSRLLDLVLGGIAAPSRRVSSRTAARPPR